MFIRKLPAVCSVLALAGPVTHGLAQAPLQPPSSYPTAMGLYAQAAPAVPAGEATPTPLDPTIPAPIAPPPATLNGLPGAAPAPGQPLPPPVDTAAPANLNNANLGGARARQFDGDDLTQVLRLLARQAKINLILSQAVSAEARTVNLRLEDVTALQAIEIICEAQGYDLTQSKGVYHVKTQAERAQEATQSDYYTFSYARAANVAPLLAGQLKSKGSAPQVDERTNTIFYQEAKSNLGTIREFLTRVDRPTRQVMIEARLVEVNSNPTQSYGINWAGVVGSAASPKTFRYGGSSVVEEGQTTPKITTDANGALVSQDFLRGNALKPGIGGVVDSALSGQIAILDIPSFSATLRFLNEDSDAEFLANPRIVTADNLEATIKIVRNQPVPQLNFNEQTATAVFGGFTDKVFGSTLVVKPSINKDNFVTMSVKPEISNRVGDQVFNFAGAQVSSPIIDTRTLEANVLIKSGCTLAIGGLLQDQTSKGITKVPILGDIPILGYLFQEHLNSRNKRDLLVFVTPTIISQTYGTGLEDQITGLKSINPRTEYADPNGWRNNAKGALQIKKPSDTQLSGQYPAPGDCNPKVSFKETAVNRTN